MPQPQIIANWAINGLPIDLKVSADETFAIVRTASFGSTPTGYTYLLDLTLPGAPIQLSVSHPGGWNSSDFADVIDDYAIASTWIATGSTSRDLMIVPKTATSPAQVTISNTPGNAPDVAVAYHAGLLTPYAAVRGDFGVSLWDLAAGTNVQTDYFAVQPCGGGGGQAGFAIGCSDSIVMSGTRYATISNFQYPLAPQGSAFERSSAVVIGAFAASTSGFPVTHQLTGTQAVQGGPCSTPEHVLHDLAMTPDGRFTVVAGTRTFAIYRNRDGTLRDRRWMPHHPELPTPRFVIRPSEWQTTDSVETSDRRTVFIGNAAPFSEAPVPSGTADTDTFRVTIADLDYAVPRYWNYGPADVGLPSGTPSRAHDLAITPNGSKSLVTTRAGLLLFDLTVSSDSQVPLPFPIQFFPMAPDPLLFGANFAPTPQASVDTWTNFIVCSDSVACTDTVAVTIGRSRTVPPSGQIFIVNLTTGLTSVHDLGTEHVPTDLAVSPDGSKVAVYSMNRLPTANPSGSSRVTVLHLPSGAAVVDTMDPSFGGPHPIGHAFGRDHVETGNHFVVSAGEDYPNTAGSSTNPLLAKGWVQVVRVQ